MFIGGFSSLWQSVSAAVKDRRCCGLIVVLAFVEAIACVDGTTDRAKTGSNPLDSSYFVRWLPVLSVSRWVYGSS